MAEKVIRVRQMILKMSFHHTKAEYAELAKI